MSHEEIKTSIHDAFDEEPTGPAPTPAPGSGNPGLPVACLIFAVAGAILGVFVSWMLSVVAGIVAIALGIMARKQASPHRGLTRAGMVLGAVCILGSVLLVVIYAVQLASLGLL